MVRLKARPLPVVLAPAHDDFWDHVRRLPRRQAQSVALRYVCDLEVAEIARTLGCSEGSVKVHLSRAREALSVQLRPDVEAGP